jgi:hypothetical protein
MNRDWPAANHRAAWSFSPAPVQSLAGRTTRSPQNSVNENGMVMERQQRSFSDDPYATRSTAGAVDASVRPCVPARHRLLVARRATHVGGPFSHPALAAPLLLAAPLALLQQAAPAAARPSIPLLAPAPPPRHRAPHSLTWCQAGRLRVPFCFTRHAL